jgi:hypothetical protein
MRRTSIWILCLGMAAAAPFAVAGSSASAAVDQPAAEMGPVSGDIVTLYGASNSFLAKSGSQDQLFYFEDKTGFTPEGTTATNLKIGAKVTVWYRIVSDKTGDLRMATKIHLQPE